MLCKSWLGLLGTGKLRDFGPQQGSLCFWLIECPVLVSCSGGKYFPCCSPIHLCLENPTLREVGHQR